MDNQCETASCSSNALRNSAFCFHCYKAHEAEYQKAKAADEVTRAPSTALVRRDKQMEAAHRVRDRARVQGRSATSRWMSGIGTGMMTAYMSDLMMRRASRSKEDVEANVRAHDAESLAMLAMAALGMFMDGKKTEGDKKDG